MTKHAATTSELSVSIRTRLQTGITWNLAGSVFNQGSTFAVNIIVANLLGRQIFGEYAIIQSTLLTLSMIAQLGIGSTVMKYVAEFRSVDPQKTGRILGLSSLISAVTAGIAAIALLVSAPWLATNMLNAPNLIPGLMIAAGVVFFTVLNGYQMGALAGLEGYRALGKAGIASGLLYLFICTTATWVGGLNGALVGLVISALLQSGILNWFLQRECARQSILPSYQQLWQERAIFFNFALPSAFSGLTYMPALWLAQTFLVRQPGGYEQMALYGAANNFRVIVLFLPYTVNNVGMSLLNYQKGVGDKAGYRKVFWFNLALTAVAVLCGAVGVALLGPFALKVFGKNFEEGYPVLLILIVATCAEAMWLAMLQVIQSQGKMWLSLLVVTLPRDGIIVVLAYLLSPSSGAAGLAWAFALGWIWAVLLTLAALNWLNSRSS